jgi:hypothetical protein
MKSHHGPSWLVAIAILSAFAATAAAKSAPGSTATITNNPPHLDANTTLFVSEGGSGTITNLLLLATDVESPATAITFTINPDGNGSAPSHGQVRLSGVPLGSGGTSRRTTSTAAASRERARWERSPHGRVPVRGERWRRRAGLDNAGSACSPTT